MAIWGYGFAGLLHEHESTPENGTPLKIGTIPYDAVEGFSQSERTPGTLGKDGYKVNSYVNTAKGWQASATPEGGVTEDGDDATSEEDEDEDE